MKTTTSKNPNAIRKQYSAPTIDVKYIEMEHGIAAGSANAVPNSPNVQHEWETGNDSEQEIYW